MAGARQRTGPHTGAQEAATVALSPAAAVVGQALGQWRNRIAETQTLLRLTLSLLQSPESMTDEQRAQLGRLMAVEERVLSQLPALDFVTLRSTTNARESGVDLRGPDTSAAEAHLGRLRDRVRSHVGRIAAALPKAGIERAIAAMLDVVRHALDELGRAIELISTALYPRVSNPTVGLGDAIERAAASRSQPVTIEGARDEHVQQVRGLVRFLGELVGSVGGSAYVHVARDGLWVHATIAPLSTSAVDEDTDARISTYARDQLLRLAAYLLRVGAERDEGAWRVTFVAQSKQ